MIQERKSGILLHITSLPAAYGIGDLGEKACWFADRLTEARQTLWQVLPINPTDGASYHSPYSAHSVFAGNTLLVSPQSMAEKRWIDAGDLQDKPVFSEESVEFDKVLDFKEGLFQKAFGNFQTDRGSQKDFETFCRNNAGWLEDYVLYVALKEHFGGKAWYQWPPEYRDRHESALDEMAARYPERLQKARFLQFVFFSQWNELKSYCLQKGIQLIGDMPIYVSYDSVDVWTNPGCFKLKANKDREFCAGVPPDYFSETGQLWGNPVYDWDKLREDNFSWWMARIEQNLALFDFTRIDHFRGLVAYWEIPAEEETAVNGRWVKVPVDDFLGTLQKRFPGLPILAEDLGIITDDVKEVMKRYRIPGMKVLLFAFSEDLKKHPYLPHNYVKNCVAYTGTHDNNTARGWFEKEAGDKEKKNLEKYLNKQVTAETVSRDLIQLVMTSRANIVLFPLQDILGLGEEARMNLPGTGEGNWIWRLKQENLQATVIERLADLTRETGR